MSGPEDYVLVTLLLPSLQIHGHHTPGEVVHALVVWDPGLCVSKELPYLNGVWVVLLHLLRALEVVARSHVLPLRKG